MSFKIFEGVSTFKRFDWNRLENMDRLLVYLSSTHDLTGIDWKTKEERGEEWVGVGGEWREIPG